MRGRDLFRLIKPVLMAGTAVLRLLPHRLVVATWWMVDWIPGHLGTGLRFMYAKRLCKSCGDNVKIDRFADIRYWDRLVLGDNVTIHELVYMDAYGGIEIKSDSTVAHMASVLSFEHAFWEDPSKTYKENRIIAQPIEIGADCCVGCGARVLGGITLGTRIMLGANSVATRSLLEPGLYGGAPAKLLRRVPPPPAATAEAQVPVTSTTIAA